MYQGNFSQHLDLVKFSWVYTQNIFLQSLFYFTQLQLKSKLIDCLFKVCISLLLVLLKKKCFKCYGLKQYRFIISQLWRSEILNASYRAEIKMSGGLCFFLEVLGENPVFVFPASRGCLYSVAPFHLQTKQWPVKPFSWFHVSGSHTSATLYPFKDP